MDRERQTDSDKLIEWPNYKSQEKQEQKLYQRDVPTSDSTK